MDYSIRYATKEDAKAILDIYSYYITDTTVTFELDVPSLEAFTTRVKNISNGFPYFVCEQEGKVIGYAYATKFKERAAYNHSVESTVYLAHDKIKSGLGRVLYARLFEELKTRGFKNIYAFITLPNENSLRLHEYFGFTEVGVFHKSGFKHEKLLDVICLEKIFN